MKRVILIYHNMSMPGSDAEHRYVCPPKRLNFSAMVSHLSRDRLHELVAGQLFLEACWAYWRCDLANAQKPGEVAFNRVGWWAKDLRYLLLTLLPGHILQVLVGSANYVRGGGRP